MMDAGKAIRVTSKKNYSVNLGAKTDSSAEAVRSDKNPVAGFWFPVCLNRQRRLFQLADDRIVLLDHAAGHQPAFVLRNNDFVGAGVANRIGVALLAGT